MSERDTENGEDLIDESGRNATQRDIDENGPSGAPVDVEWEAGDGEVAPEAEDRGDDGAIGRARGEEADEGEREHEDAAAG